MQRKVRHFIINFNIHKILRLNQKAKIQHALTYANQKMMTCHMTLTIIYLDDNNGHSNDWLINLLKVLLYIRICAHWQPNQVIESH